MHVYRSDPTQRGFSQPCPLWKGQCTIYHSAHYPRACRAYRCKLLKDVCGEAISLSQALVAVKQAKEMINQLEPLLPASASQNFRERLVAYYEHPPESARQADAYQEFRLKADALLLFYETVFGVNDLIESNLIQQGGGNA